MGNDGLKNLMEGKDSKFTLSLIIIAILIPIFLDYFPKIVDKIIPFLPIYLKLDFVTLISIILGIFWFMVLLIGLLKIESKDKDLFYRFFYFGRYFTIMLVLSVFFTYFIYFLNLAFGYEKIINWVILILAGIIIIYWWKIIKEFVDLK